MITYEQVQDLKRRRMLKQLEPEDTIKVCQDCGRLQTECVCSLPFIDRIEEARIDERCNKEVAEKILSQLINWKGYKNITVQTIKDSFNINKHTAQRVYRMLKKVRKDLNFPIRRQINHLSLCKKCRKGYWSKADSEEYKKRLCSQCLSS